jgi:hypothetical protein
MKARVAYTRRAAKQGKEKKGLLFENLGTDVVSLVASS